MTQNKCISIKSLFVVAILMCINADAFSQSFTSPIPWHHTSYESRISALAQSTAALGNSSPFNINPAVPVEAGVLTVSSFLPYARIFEAPEDGADLYSPAIGFSTGRLSYSAMIDYTSFSVPADFGSSIDNYSNRMIRFRAGYQITEAFSVGAGLLHSSYKSPTFAFDDRELGGDASAWGIDLGLYYTTMFESKNFLFRPQAGLSLNSIGPGFSYESTDMPDDNLPGQIRLGVGVDVQTKRRALNHQLIGLGLYTGFSKYLARKELQDNPADLNRPGGFEALFTTWNSFEQFTGSEVDVISLGDQISASLGVELQFLETLYLRYGILGGADSWVHPQHALGAELDFYYIALAVTHLNYHSSEQWGPRENPTYIQGTFRIPLDGNARDTLIGRLF